MQKSLKKRAYDASSRRQAAEATRKSILEAARSLFLEKGYAATTMPKIAQAAGIALDTVYATVGKKPALFRLLIEIAISGNSAPVPAEERSYVQAIRDEPDASRKLQIYAEALGEMQPRLAPLIALLQHAATLDPELEALWQVISNRRANNMRLLAQDLAATGQLRTDLSIEKIADILWSMNAPEYYLLLANQRGWSPEEFAHWLADAWKRLLLKP
jgi:AcrR family transcriptional regulator